MATTFWIAEPSILLNKKYITQVYPTSFMTMEEKMNAVTRAILFLTILGLLITKSPYLLLAGGVAVAAVAYIYNTNNTKSRRQEGFKISSPAELKKFLKTSYSPTESVNPMSNVLLTDIADNPDKLPAPPAFDVTTYENINDTTQQMIQTLNPGIRNTNKQLFGDLGEKFEFDQSQRAFYSTANTKVTADQGAYAQYLYGNMPSCRGGDAMACVQDNARYNLY